MVDAFSSVKFYLTFKAGTLCCIENHFFIAKNFPPVIATCNFIKAGVTAVIKLQVAMTRGIFLALKKWFSIHEILEILQTDNEPQFQKN